MGVTKTHWLLCAADDYPAACDSVRTFFRNSLLLHYDAVETAREGSWSAVSGDEFWRTVEDGIAENRLALAGMLDELKAEGCSRIADLATLPMGYPSKVLHTVAHLLDGFIGIDSVFYNLAEDSHWLSDRLRETILLTPARYWLIRVEASFASASIASLIHQAHKLP